MLNGEMSIICDNKIDNTKSYKVNGFRGLKGVIVVEISTNVPRYEADFHAGKHGEKEEVFCFDATF